MKRRGISLIVLIVTIIVIIILAAVVILTISKNNPIESAKEATFKEDVRTFQDELAMYIAKDYTNKAGARDEKITATNYNPVGDPKSVYTYIPSFSKKYEGKFVIKNDELMYKEEMIQQEKDWCQSLNVKENAKTGAEKAKEDPQNYYGAKVDYKTGNEDIDNDITEWKIFYSDGSNVYIISADYVDPVNLPGKNDKKTDFGNETYPKAAYITPVLSQYNNGSACITDTKMRAFNSDYFKERIDEETGEKYTFSSTLDNMKVVAYMLDKEIWSKLYANSSVAEYAVGGPSIEMTLNSYSEKKNVNFKVKATSEKGYQVSINGGTTWNDSYWAMLNTSEKLYVLPADNGALAMCMSSPSYRGDRNILTVNAPGSIQYYDHKGNYLAYRPLVCLNSNVILNWNEQDQIFEIK